MEVMKSRITKTTKPVVKGVKVKPRILVKENV